nr:tRNA lysidine(34) synthetase TilS [Propionibacterium sp.]
GVADALRSLPVPHAAPLTLPARVVRVAVTGTGAGPEASAREVRYAALAAAAGPGERVLLGHTLDDQAETVLLGLARGSGARSLAGMAAERGVFVRPLLTLGREVTAAACAELGLTPWADPMNADPRFARVRVREVVLPTLERELGPGVREALARTAAQLRRDADVLDALAAGPEPGADAAASETLSCRRLAGLEPAIRDRVVRAWLAARGASEVTAAHVAAVTALVTDWHGQRAVHGPGLVVRRVDGRLRADPPAGDRGRPC